MTAIEKLLKDIKARTKEILFHHRSPIQSRHGKTSPICEDILTRCAQALALLKEECKWRRSIKHKCFFTDCGCAVGRENVRERIYELYCYNCGQLIKEIK